MVEALESGQRQHDDHSATASTDGFELISDESMVGTTDFSIISNEYGSQLADEKDGIAPDDGPEGVYLIDPLEAFEMIQSDHRVLKDELEPQNQLLRQRVSEMEDGKRPKAQELIELKDKIHTLSLELDKKKSEEMDLKRQVHYFKECSEKADLLTTKLMEAEDVVKEQDALLKQMQRDGYAGIPPPTPALSTDQALATELTKKDEQIKKMEESLALVESALGSLYQQRIKALEEARYFKEINVTLKAETEMDNEKWAAKCSDMKQKIEMLSGQVATLEHQLASPSSTAAADLERKIAELQEERDKFRRTFLFERYRADVCQKELDCMQVEREKLQVEQEKLEWERHRLQSACHLCGGYGHWKKECPHGNERKCFNCLRYGHILPDCPYPVRCNVCHCNGHMAANCPSGAG